MRLSKSQVACVLLAVFVCAGCADMGGNGTGDPTDSETAGAYFEARIAVHGGVFGEASQPLPTAKVSLGAMREEQPSVTGELIDEERAVFKVMHRFGEGERAPERMLLTVEAAGHAPQYFQVPPVPGDVPVALRAQLQSTEHFEVENVYRLGMMDQRVSVTLPPAVAVAGEARLFDPLVETGAMPGALVDTLGRFLGASVFSSVTLRDREGARVSRLDASTVLRMKIPRSAWSSLVAIEPGDDFIEPGDDFIEPGDDFIEPGDDFIEPGDDFIEPGDDFSEVVTFVPIYGFDTRTGAWSIQHAGWLENASGDWIPMESLHDIWAGGRNNELLADGLFVAAKVSHLSYWGIAWPYEEQASIGGCLRDDENNPLRGVTVSARSLARPVSVKPTVTGEKGCFCLEVPPALDENGYALQLVAFHMGDGEGRGSVIHREDLGEVTVTPDFNRGTCNEEERDELELRFTPRHDSPLDVCSFRVRLDIDENHEIDLEQLEPLIVSARLPSSPKEMLDACRERCLLETMNHERGVFELEIPRGQPVLVDAVGELHEAHAQKVLEAKSALTGCDDESIVLTLSGGIEIVELDVLFDADVITWSEPLGENDSVAANSVEVRSPSGELKWAVVGEGQDRPFDKVEYRVPRPEDDEMWKQIYPSDGSEPGRIEEGDEVRVFSTDMRDGFIANLQGSTVVGQD